ncbi:MAG: hypothetical protein JWM89_3423 [Acidimicrobiales bacterium]|nr:hypothetical protein [Acidimicrobiales bacterium]
MRDALRTGAATVAESPDLFARVRLSITDDRRLRAQHRAATAIALCIVGAFALIVFGFLDHQEGRFLMDWWILELLTDAVLIGIAFWLGPLIKRFGKSYAADVFRANPRTGKSFVVLTDVAYYLIFLSYVLFTLTFEPRGGWSATVDASQLQHETSRVAGILLIIGLLHGVNLLVLPVMGRLLTLNRHLDSTPPAGDGDR